MKKAKFQKGHFIKQVAKLGVVEHFYSLQGEGKYSGRAALFFRLAGCNLRCMGFGVELVINSEKIVGCDTIRAVYTNHFKPRQISTLSELTAILNGYKFQKKPIVVITGGEPLLWYKNELFYSFINYILDSGYSLHFETNGTINLDFESYPRYKEAVFCISPKLSNSGESREKRLNPKALSSIKQNAKEFFYKFVIDKSIDSAEIDQIVAIAEGDVYCMPLGSNKKELDANTKFCFEFCIKKGYNYSDRLHIRAFDDKEGV